MHGDAALERHGLSKNFAFREIDLHRRHEPVRGAIAADVDEVVVDHAERRDPGQIEQGEGAVGQRRNAKNGPA